MSVMRKSRENKHVSDPSALAGTAQEVLEGTTMISPRKAISPYWRRNCSCIGCLTVLAIVAVVVAVRIAYSKSSTVRFTLTFEDCPVPDMSSYHALILHGAGFDYKRSGGYERVLYGWFARALHYNGLQMALTYRGYAQCPRRDDPGSNVDLANMATEQVVANQVRLRTAGIYASPFHLIGISSKVLPDGAPYSWNLPKIKGSAIRKSFGMRLTGI